MITISYYRFAPTTKVVKLKKDCLYHNVFITVFDHEDRCNEDQCPLERAINIVHKWLENHYGYCIIYRDNQTEYDKPFKKKYCNHKKFKKEFKESFNCDVLIERYKK